MGRLSKLQKHILIESYKKLILKDGTNYVQRFLDSEDAKRWNYYFRSEILKSYYGWKERKVQCGVSRSAYFSKREIGEKEYNKVMVTVTRTINNLHEKGLVEVWKGLYVQQTRLTLTEAGIETAKRLLEQQKS